MPINGLHKLIEQILKQKYIENYNFCVHEEFLIWYESDLYLLFLYFFSCSLQTAAMGLISILILVKGLPVTKLNG